MDDDGLVYLKGLANLEKLGLQHSNVTEAGMVHLEGLTNLRELELGDRQVTDEGVKKLQQALPDCKIGYLPRP